MSIKRKGSGIAFTATLLASLLMTVAAPLVSATVAVTSAGSVPAGGQSNTPATIDVTENAAACYDNPAVGGPDLTFTIRDSSGPFPDPDGGGPLLADPSATVHFVAPVVTSVPPPGSLGGFSVTLVSTPDPDGPGPEIAGVNDRIEVNFNSSDPLNIERFALQAAISADSGASPGAIRMYVGGTQAGCVRPGGTFPLDTGTLTTQGQLVAAEAIGAGDGGGDGVLELVNVGPCAFAPTGGVNSTLRIGSNAAPTQSIGIDAVTALVVNTQDVEIAAPGLAAAQAANTLVFQTVADCTIGTLGTQIGSPGTVVVALAVTANATPIVLPGENNQVAGSITVSESPSGGSLNGQTLTFAISSPASGVLFSNSPGVSYTGGANGPTVCSISADRKSCTVAGITSAAVGDTVTVGTGANPIRYDVDQAVPLGTAVKITVTTSPAVALIGGTVTNAFVGRVVVSSAAQPIVFIGFNDQPTGVITFTESGTGFFTAGGGPNNVFGLCPLTGESFTRAPHARVVNAGAGAGQTNLLLLNPATATGVTLQQGTLATGLGGVQCAYWTVHTASSTNPAVIELVGADTANVALPGGAGNPTNGPRVSVPNGLTPGSVQFALNIGTLVQVLGVGGFSQIVSNAIRAFKNSINVVAVSQPRCAKGTADCLAGNIRITETQAGQFKPGDVFVIRFLARATPERMDVLLKSGVTNDLPIPTANTAQSGLAVAPVGINCNPSAIFVRKGQP